MSRLTDILRHHYEKIILSAVLLGLALAVLYVYSASQRAEEEVAQSVTQILGRKPKPVLPVDLTNTVAALQLHQKPPPLHLSTNHNLFNPVKWKRRPDGTLLKITTDDVVGWDKMFITRITPLHFTLALDKIPNPPTGYFIGYQHEAAERFQERRKYSPYLKINETNKTVPRPLVLRQIHGPSEKPDQLLIELLDTGEKITIGPDKPFQRVEAYEADLKHELINQPYLKLRAGSPLRFLNDDYIVLAVNSNEVVVSARANDKKYTISQRAPAATNTPPAASALAPPK